MFLLNCLVFSGKERENCGFMVAEFSLKVNGTGNTLKANGEIVS